MAGDQGFVIVGSDGTEHEFPAGFDPQRAAGIVRATEYRPDPGVRDRTTRMLAEHAGVMPLGVPTLTDELGHPVDRQTGRPLDESAISMRNPDMQALNRLAHPSSVSDILGLLVPNAMGAGETSLPSLARGTLRMVRRGGQAAADGPLTSAPMRFIRGAMAEVNRPLSVERFAPNVSGSPFVADAAQLNRWETMPHEFGPRGSPFVRPGSVSPDVLPLAEQTGGIQLSAPDQLREGYSTVIPTSQTAAPIPLRTTTSLDPEQIRQAAAEAFDRAMKKESMTFHGKLIEVDPRVRDLILKQLKGE